jgi:NitT/TauT family transport system permease protein
VLEAARNSPVIRPASLARQRRTVTAVAARVGPPMIVAIAALIAWEISALTIFAGRSYLLPGPLDVAAAIAANGATVGAATLTTFSEAAFGYASAIVIGVAVAALFSQSRLLERSLSPYAVLLQTVPVVAVAPLIVLWSGYNSRSVVIVSLIISVFPIISNTLLGLRSTSRNLVDLFNMHHSGRLTTLFKLRVPSALPNIFAGLRISAGLSVIGAIIGEFIIGSGNAQGGLGVQIIFAQGRMYTALLFAEIIAATLLGFIFYTIVGIVGDALLRHWHESAAD